MAKFAAGVFVTGSKFAAGVVNTGGNFAAGVVDTGGKLSLIPVVHLDLRISPRMFETFLIIYFGAGGKLIHKKPEAKNLVTLSLVNKLKKSDGTANGTQVGGEVGKVAGG